MGIRQEEYCNIVKDHFLNNFNDDGSLLHENYDSVVDQIYARMKGKIQSRCHMIKRYVENQKCKATIAQMKINNDNEDNSDDSVMNVDVNDHELSNISIEETIYEEEENIRHETEENMRHKTEEDWISSNLFESDDRTSATSSRQRSPRSISKFDSGSADIIL